MQYRFQLPLLAALGRTINYHNGVLPGMRGVRASNWSIYLGHSHSGYAFHEMSEALDDGRILIEGRHVQVTGIRRTRPGTRPGFMTSDGQWLQVTAIAFWPAWVSRLGLAGGSH